MSPKPLSNLLIPEISQDASEAIVDVSLNQKLHSNEFASAIVDVIQALDENRTTSIDNQVEELTESVLKNINCLISNQIKIHFLDCLTRQKIEGSERDLNFACLINSSTDELTFRRSKQCSDELEKYFYLAEAILDSIQNSFSHKSENNNIQMLNDILKKHNHRFILLVIKLLQSHNDNFKDIIDNYHLNSLFIFK
jgi:hypothetical protein